MLEVHDVTRTETVTIACKYCGSTNVVKYGMHGSVQYYWCKDCRRKFAGNQALPHMHFPPDQIATALQSFYEGLSLNAIRRQLDQLYGKLPSDSTVYEWIVRFTKAAQWEANHACVHASKVWAVDETVLEIDGKNAWFWDVIDDETRFLLASHLSVSRTMEDAVAVLVRAQKVAMLPPRFIVSDGLAAYPDAVDRVFGADTVHIRSRGIRDEINNNLIERFHGTIKQRTKVMRGMQNIETAKLVMGGWLVNYNFFRPHEALHGKTPGEMAKVQFPFTNWAAVVHRGYHRQEIRTGGKP
ncbi:MAG: IS6 family transposase [Chloroflexi bacterium]|nr:IS6 family transposase [Chloroflexota bacterium]